MVKLDFPLLKLALPNVQANFVQSLDGIGCAGMDIHSCIYYTIRSDSQNASEFQPVGKKKAQSIFRSTNAM